MAEAAEERLRALEEELQQLRLRNVAVTVNAPPALPKLRSFTGLPPTSGQEVSYREWKQQAREVEGDGLVQDKVGVLRRTLKGPAHECMKGKLFDSVGALVDELGKLFGDLKSPEDLYVEISQSRPARGQALSDVLLTLSQQMGELRDEAGLSGNDYHRRLFSVFARAIQDPLLALELRNKFGVPGFASPTFHELFTYVRQVEGLKTPKTPRVEAHTVEYRAEEEKTPPPPPPSRMPQPTNGTASSRPNKNFKKACFKCGELGHFHRGCPNAANPEKVVANERERRRQENDWRRRQGLPLLLLN